MTVGAFEQLVLLAILHLGNHAYGMEIKSEIEARTGREISYGAVYTALDRLEGKAHVSHELGDATPERGGRARKYFRVEPEGLEALRAARKELDVMWEGISI